MIETIIDGVLELNCMQSSSGENIYFIDIINEDDSNLYNILGDYEGKKVRIFIEETK